FDKRLPARRGAICVEIDGGVVRPFDRVERRRRVEVGVADLERNDIALVAGEVLAELGEDRGRDGVAGDRQLGKPRHGRTVTRGSFAAWPPSPLHATATHPTTPCRSPRPCPAR